MPSSSLFRLMPVDDEATAPSSAAAAVTTVGGIEFESNSSRSASFNFFFSIMLSLIVPSVKSRWNRTFLARTMRWGRSIACWSVWGFKSVSLKLSETASIKLMMPSSSLFRLILVDVEATAPSSAAVTAGGNSDDSEGGWSDFESSSSRSAISNFNGVFSITSWRR